MILIQTPPGTKKPKTTKSTASPPLVLYGSVGEKGNTRRALFQYLTNFPPKIINKATRYAVLIHGPPGVGKSELVRAACAHFKYRRITLDEIQDQMLFGASKHSFTSILKSKLMVKKCGHRIAFCFEMDSLLDTSHLNALARFLGSDDFKQAKIPAILVSNSKYGTKAFAGVVKLCTQIAVYPVSERACAYCASKLSFKVAVPENRRGRYHNRSEVQLRVPNKDVQIIARMCLGDVRKLKQYAEEVVRAQVQGRFDPKTFRLGRVDARASVFNTARQILRCQQNMAPGTGPVVGLVRCLYQSDKGSRNMLHTLIQANYCQEYADDEEDVGGCKITRAVHQHTQRGLTLQDSIAQVQQTEARRVEKWIKRQQKAGGRSTIQTIEQVAAALSDMDVMNMTAAQDAGELYMAGTVNRQTRHAVPPGTSVSSLPPFGSYVTNQKEGTAVWNHRNPQYNEQLSMAPRAMSQYRVIEKQKKVRSAAYKITLSSNTRDAQIRSDAVRVFGRSYLDIRNEVQLQIQKLPSRTMQHWSAEPDVMDADRSGLTEADMSEIFELDTVSKKWMY
jgi:hypothetical protein